MHKGGVMKNSKRFVIMYDFDKTLSTKYMSEFGLIKDLKYKASSEFWDFCNITIAKGYNMDNNLAFMLGNIKRAEEIGLKLTKKYLQSVGRSIEFFDGVETWFRRINLFGKKHGLEIEHYIISSGIEEIIQGSPIYKYFTKVFASSFAYNNDGEAFWPRLIVNYTAKTQYIFRIKKNLVEDLTDDKEINRKYEENECVIPYKNMVYIGDGETDVPCMKLVKEKGGHSVCLYNDSKQSRVVAEEILNDERVDIIANADYTERSELDKYIKKIIMSVAENK